MPTDSGVNDFKGYAHMYVINELHCVPFVVACNSRMDITRFFFFKKYLFASNLLVLLYFVYRQVPVGFFLNFALLILQYAVGSRRLMGGFTKRKPYAVSVTLRTRMILRIRNMITVVTIQ